MNFSTSVGNDCHQHCKHEVATWDQYVCISYGQKPPKHFTRDTDTVFSAVLVTWLPKDFFELNICRERLPISLKTPLQKWKPGDLSLLRLTNWNLHKDTLAMFKYQEDKPGARVKCKFMLRIRIQQSGSWTVSRKQY